MAVAALKDFYFLFVIILIKTAAGLSSPRFREGVICCVAEVAHRLSGSKRCGSRRSVAAALRPTISDSDARRITKRAFYDFWSDILSVRLTRADRTALKQAEVRGLEHLNAALENGKGVILWESRHFGRRILAKQILHQHDFAIHQVYGRNHVGGFLSEAPTWMRQNIVERFFDRCEREFLADILYLPNSDSLVFVRTVLRRLQRNAIVCIPGDGAFGHKLMSVKFLGSTSLLPTGIVSLARTSGASLLPMFCINEETGAKVLIIESPIRLETSPGREQTMEKCLQEYASMLEGYARRYPHAYRNWHLLGWR